MHQRGKSPETSSYEPQLAHSTRLPKPPGYNLEWSRVTPIQDTLIIRPSAKASHHEHHLKLCRKPFLVHYHWTKTALRTSHAARRNLVPDRLAGISHRQAPSAIQKPCRSVTTWRDTPCRQAPYTSSGHCDYFRYLSPSGSPRAARHHTSSAMLLVFGISLGS